MFQNMMLQKPIIFIKKKFTYSDYKIKKIWLKILKNKTLVKNASSTIEECPFEKMNTN